MPLLLIGALSPSAPTPKTLPHLRLRCGPLDALAIDADADAPATPGEAEARTLDWARRQTAILCDYVAASDVLPVKIGAAFSDACAVIRHVRAAAPLFRRIDAQLCARVEFAVSLRETETAAAAEPDRGNIDGRAYLRRGRNLRDRRAGRNAERRRFVAGIGEQLCGPGRLVRRDQPRDRLSPARWSVLLPREEVSTLLSDLNGSAETAGRLGFVIEAVGPWPAFSFLDDCGAVTHG